MYLDEQEEEHSLLKQIVHSMHSLLYFPQQTKQTYSLHLEQKPKVDPPAQR